VGAGTAEVTVAVSLSTARSGGRRVDARTRRGAGDGGGGRGGAAPDGAELGTAAARTRRGGQAWAAAEDGPLRRGAWGDGSEDAGRRKSIFSCIPLKKDGLFLHATKKFEIT